jgi:hypothetical protein
VVGRQTDLYVLADSRARATLQGVLVTPSSTAAAVWTYVLAPDACDKYEALRLAISYHSVSEKRYSAFMFFDSIARGPFQPSYAAGVPWTRAFAAKLTANTHLVGSSIRCGWQRDGGDDRAAGAATISASFYVEDFAVAFDVAGLNALQEVLASVPCAARMDDNDEVARLWSQKLLSWVRPGAATCPQPCA